MIYIKEYKEFNIKFDQKKFNKFLDKFPNDAKSWANATDELADMYVWMCEVYNDLYEDDKLLPVGRKKILFPSEYNTKYKTVIVAALDKFDDNLKNKLMIEFIDWLK